MINAAKLLQMKQDRAAAILAAGAILKKATDENRSLTEEESGLYDQRFAEGNAITRTIQADEKQTELERSLDTQIENRNREEHENPDLKLQRKAFDLMLRRGLAGVPDELRAHLYNAREAALDFGREEKRDAQSSVTGNLGGYTVPDGVMQQIQEAKKFYGGIMEAKPNIIRTSGGNPIPWPTTNDTGTKGVILPENSPESSVSIPFDTLTLGAYKYSSRIVLIPLELLQDSGIDIEGLVVRKLAERLGRIQNEHQTTGTGTNQPQGVVVGATLGKSAASATAVTYAELVDLKYSVNRAYRREAKWMMNDNTFGKILKLVDTAGRPLMLDYIRGMQEAERETLIGQDVIMNDDMATMATTAKSILYGAFSNYAVRIVNAGMIMRLTERYAEYGQVGFLCFERMDARLIDAGTHPIKYLQQA